MIEMRLCLVSLSRMCVSYYDWIGTMQTSDEFEEVQYKNVNRLYSTECVGREKNQNKKRWVMYFSSDHQSPYQTFTYEWFSSWTLIIYDISYNILVMVLMISWSNNILNYVKSINANYFDLNCKWHSEIALNGWFNFRFIYLLDLENR